VISISKKQFLFLPYTAAGWLLFLATVAVSPTFSQELIGIKSIETGGWPTPEYECHLVAIDTATGEFTQRSPWYDPIGCIPIAFVPSKSKLISVFGGGNGAIWTIDQEAAEEILIRQIASGFIDDPSPPTLPDGVDLPQCESFYGCSFRSLAFDPDSQALYAVVTTSGTGNFHDFLVRIDGNLLSDLIENPPAVPGPIPLEVIGLLGGYGSSAALGDDRGYMWVNIAFDYRSGELLATGIDLGDRDGDDDRHLFKITESAANPPLISTLDQGDLDVPVESIAVDPFTGTIYGTTDRCLYTVSREAGTTQVVCGLEAPLTSLAFASSCNFDPPSPPTISSFRPLGGNAGIVVEITGSNFCSYGQSNIEAAFFGDLPALSPPIVWGDSLLTVRTPDIVENSRIRITDKQGNARTGSQSFTAESLVVNEFDVTQGIIGQPLIAGKETLVRLLTASTTAGRPVTFGDAVLHVTTPSGSRTDVPAHYYTPIFSNGPGRYNVELSHRSNINFYLPGELLIESGRYEFQASVRAYSVDGLGREIYSETESAIFRATPGDLRLLYWYGYRGGSTPEAEERSPTEIPANSIGQALSEVSRIYPVRSGIGPLGSDSHGLQIKFVGGVRFNTQTTQWYGNISPCEQLERGWRETFEEYVLEFNEANCDLRKAEYAVGFIRSSAVHMPETDYGTEEWGCVLGKSNASATVIYDGDSRLGLRPMDRQKSLVTSHELAHSMGLVYDFSPNYGGKSHSKNDEFPINDNVLADFYDIRPFNVPDRTALFEHPRSVMHVAPQGDRPDDGEFAFEEYEYDRIRMAEPPVLHSGFEVCPIIGCSWPFCSEWYAVLRIREDAEGNGSAEISKSYIVQNAPVDDIDPNSPYSLVFLDSSNQVLSRDPISVLLPDDASIDGERSAVFAVTRPLPSETKVVQIRKNEEVLATLGRSTGAPEIVRLDSPTAGQDLLADEQVSVAWRAEDPDGDPLTFSVHYSPNPDGSGDSPRWIPVVPSTSASEFVWDTSGIPGTDSGQLKIIVSDGFNASVYLSDRFSVADKPPMVSVVRPRGGTVFQEFDTIVLEALVVDPESGVLDGESISWLVADRKLGSGRRITLPPGELSPDTWAITLQGSDSENVVNKTVEFTVLADSDRDGLSDDYESQYESQDAEYAYDAWLDVDNDGLSSLTEHHFGTDPELSDSDRDGFSDRSEVIHGSDPVDSESMPAVRDRWVLSGNAFAYPESVFRRAHLTLQINSNALEEGRLRYRYRRSRIHFESSRIENMEIQNDVATVSGQGVLNGVEGYRFRAITVDGSPDRFGIQIESRDGSIRHAINLSAVRGGGIVLEASSEE
jgi:hypothetical protein